MNIGAEGYGVNLSLRGLTMPYYRATLPVYYFTNTVWRKRW